MIQTRLLQCQHVTAHATDDGSRFGASHTVLMTRREYKCHLEATSSLTDLCHLTRMRLFITPSIGEMLALTFVRRTTMKPSRMLVAAGCALVLFGTAPAALAQRGGGGHGGG